MTSDGADYKRAITAEWGRTAAGWHRWIPVIDAWLLEATEAMLDGAAVRTGSAVIDIAAGDGGQSVTAARRVGPGGRVLTTDIAPEFVELARATAAEQSLAQLEAAVMDAELLDAADEEFDAAISRLGLMYLPDIGQGLREIHRVLRPGGRTSAVVFTSADRTPFFSVPVQLIRKRRGLPSPAPGQPGPFALGAPGVFAEHLAAAGFRDVHEQRIEAPARFASAAECIQWRREASGTMQQLVSDLPDEEQAEIWAEVTAALEAFETTEGFESPCELLLVSAAR